MIWLTRSLAWDIVPFLQSLCTCQNSMHSPVSFVGSFASFCSLCLECSGIPLCASDFVTLNSLFSSCACRSQVTFLKFFLMMLVLIIENL